MQHQNQHSQQGFFTLYDTNAPPHMRAPSNSGSKISAQTPMAPASIWAPQPQVGDATWPRALEAFAQPNREDVFAPKQLHSAGVGAGAVGDGRASKPGSGNGSPDMRADSHVELLLRTLNLNSPEPQSIAVARSSPTTSIGAGSSSSASTGSGGRFSGRAKPAPPPLDLSFASASASMSSNSIIHSSSDSTSLSASGNISSNSNTSLQLTDDSSGSVPSMTSGSSVSMAYPQSPGSDYSPLSLSSALLTPLDSPGGALSYTPGLALGLHSPSSGHHLPSILHGHNTHASLSPGALFYKERVHQQQLQQQQGQQYPYDYLLDSPGRLPRGFGMGMGLGHAHSSPGSPHQVFQPLRSPAAPGSTPASASSRFLPLPPTPPSALSALPPYLGNGMHGGAGAGGQGSPLALGLGGSALFADGPGPVSPGSIGSNPTAGNIGDAAGAAYYRFSANADALGGDWLRPDDGLGLAFGFAQQQQQQPSPSSIGAGATLYRTGGSTFGAGAGAFAEEQPHQGPSTTGSGILRGGFVYEPQHQLHQHDQHQHDQHQHGQHQHGQHQHGQQQHQQETPLGLGLGHGFVAGAGSSGKGSWDLDAGSGSTTNAALGGTGATGAGSGGGAPSSGGAAAGREGGRGSSGGTEPINFLSLLHPASSPPYASFVSRIIKSADQQASIFLQQKLKVAGPEERVRIVDAICQRGAEMMMHRFGNWAVQRCLEAATGPEERCKIVACMRGRVVDLATNCYGCHVLQKALDCEEEEVRLLIVSELLMGDPAQTLVNKHASHVWSKIMELSWTPPAPPIFAYVNKSLKGKWAALACHETGSLVVQHAFENLEDSAKDGIVEELLGQGSTVFAEVAKNQWGAYCVQHILEHGSDKHRQMALDHLLNGLLEFATNEQGSKSVVKALKEGGKETLDRVVQRMCEPAKGARRAMVVDLALSLTGSQLIASVLPTADKDQRALLYDCIRGHIVTLRGCKTGSKVIWLFDRMRAYYGY